MSLYRKYRPQSFADVVGQDHIVTTLEKAADQNKLAHAYLFAGSRGTGKTSVARILSKILMIQSIEDEIEQKRIIKGVEEGSIVDLLEIDAASNRGIDDVRDLIEKIQFSPVASGAKVYIIDEVHMLTKAAFNALLKTLEEPPAYAFFILATTELNKIPTTIQSRCQCFPFRKIREEDIIRRLQYIADQEKITIDREAVRAIAHHAEGGMRDAISLLDQIRSLEKITLEDIEQRIGTTGQEYIEAVFLALEKNDKKALLESIQKVEESGVPLDIFTRQLLNIVRESLHEAIKEKKPTEGIITMLDTLLNTIRGIRSAPVPGLLLESALLSLCQANPENKGNIGEAASVLAQKAKVTEAEPKKDETPIEESAVKEKQETKESTEPVVESEKEPIAAEKEEEQSLKEAEVEAPEATLENIQQAWPDIVQQTSPPSVKMSLKNGRVSDIDSQTVTVSFSSSFHKDKVASTESSRQIEEAMQKIFKRQLKLECTLDGGGTHASNSEGVSEDVVNLAEAAAEIF